MRSAVRIDSVRAQTDAVQVWDFAQVLEADRSSPRHYVLDVNVCFYSLPLRGSFHKV